MFSESAAICACVWYMSVCVCVGGRGGEGGGGGGEIGEYNYTWIMEAFKIPN